MFGFGTHAKKETLGLIYDIGSDSVGGALVLFQKEKTPKIIYTARCPLPLTEYPRSGKFKSDTLAAIRKVSKRLDEEGMPHLKFTSYGRLRPRYAYCTLAAPWHTSQTRTITLKKEKSFSVSRALLDELTESELSSFLSDSAVSEELAGSPPAVIQRQIMELRLNGYETTKPYGKTATSLSAEFLVSVTPEDVMEEMISAIRSTFAVRDVSFGSFPITFFQVMRDIKYTPKNFLLCDVNGEFTEVSLVEDNVLAQTATAPAGKRTLLRTIAEETDSFPDEVLSRLQAQYEQDSYSPQLTQPQEKAQKMWIESLRTALDQLSPSSVLPKMVYVTSDPEVEEWCRDMLVREPTVINFSGAPLEVVTVGASFAESKCEFSEYVRHEDIFLALGALYAEMTHYRGSA